MQVCMQTNVCSRMLTYAHVCSRMLTYAHVCSRMNTASAAPVQFVSDVLLTFNNALLFNDKGSKIAQAASELIELAGKECGASDVLRAAYLAAAATNATHAGEYNTPRAAASSNASKVKVVVRS